MLYKQHVESFTRIGKSSIAVGHCDELLLSTNNGKKWTHLGRLPERNIIKQILWIDSQHLVINASFTGRGVIYYSKDRGRSFIAVLRNTGSSQPIQWDTTGARLYAVVNTNRFYCSTDNGRTWHITGSKIPFEQRPNVSHFCSLTSFFEQGSKVFYATTSYPGQILRSRDTGKHWERIFSDSVILRNREIPMLGKLRDGRYFAVSAGGSVDAPGYALLSSRSGREWKTLPAPEGMWSFAELPSHPGFIVATGFSLGRRLGDAAAFVTDDYGYTWQPLPILNATLVWQVECLSPSARGRSTWLLATDQGLVQLKLGSPY